MIFQGIYNILSLYFQGIDLFYNDIDFYFQEKINKHFTDSQIKTNNEKTVNDIISFLTNEFVELGLTRSKVQNRFTVEFCKIKDSEKDSITTVGELYHCKIAPIIYEVIMEQVIFYLVDNRAVPIMLSFKKKGIFNLEFIVELKNLKNLFEESPEKLVNLLKYIKIRDKIIIKFCSNKENIESLEDLQNTQDKLQLVYLVYRIIEFFNIQEFFDFSHISTYLKENFDECLNEVPIVTLKNPDLCYCGMYLAQGLNIDVDKQKIKEFLEDLYQEHKEEFDAPIIEATDRLYYYFKSRSLLKLQLTEEQINEIISADSRFFDSIYLKDLETSQLVVILKIYLTLGIFNKIDPKKIDALKVEIESRITPEGITQFHGDGIISSEATYYVLFLNYMSYSLDKLKEFDVLSSVVSRIYRNIELLNFSSDMNHDLISEIFYSVESLKLLNCIDSKQMIIYLANYMFPQAVVSKILNSDIESSSTAKCRHSKVNRITGEVTFQVV